MPIKEKAELPQQGLPAAVVPDLKKRRKERKKSGAAWGSGKPVGGSFAGAAGGEGAMGARAAAGVARAAASAARALGAEAVAEAVGAEAAVEGGFFANLFSQAGAWFSSVTATLMGKVAVAAAAALAVGLAAVVGYRMMHGSQGDASGGSLPDLGGIASTVQVPRQGADGGLGYSGSGQGLLRSSYANQNSAAPKPEEPAKDETANLPAEGAGSTELRNGMPIDRMAHNLSGAKLSSGLSAQFGGGVGTGSGAPGGASPLNIGGQNGKLGQYGGSSSALGKGGVLQAKGVQGALGNSLRHLSANASKTLALLRGMASKYNPAMRSGGNQATEENSQAATSQFEASDLVGGTAPASPTDATSSGGSSGGGAGTGGGGGSGSNAGSGTYTPTIDNAQNCDYDAGAYWNGSACVTMSPPGQNVTPWQGMITVVRILCPLAATVLAIASYLWIAGHTLFTISLSYEACQMATIVSGVMGAVVALMGVMINQMGGGMLGDYVTALGTLIAGTALWSYMLPDDSGNLTTEEILSAVIMMGSVFSAFIPGG
jgi:hypothetical protein